MLRLRLYQDVIVTAVAQECRKVTVLVRESAGHFRQIVFEFRDGLEAATHAARLSHWRDVQRRVTYVAGGAMSALIDDEEAFHLAFAGDRPEAV